MNDPHDLNRFLLAQQDDYERAVAEVKNGRKRTHWMWYIFPQIDGLGFSSMARRYGIKNADEARAYLAHPILGPRLLTCAGSGGCQCGEQRHRNLWLTRRSEVAIIRHALASVSAPDSVFHRLLEKFYPGSPDKETFRLLGISKLS